MTYAFLILYLLSADPAADQIKHLGLTYRSHFVRITFLALLLDEKGKENKEGTRPRAGHGDVPSCSQEDCFSPGVEVQTGCETR